MSEEPRTKIYKIEITLITDEPFSPDRWDWDQLLDLHGNEEIILNKVEFIGYEAKDD